MLKNYFKVGFRNLMRHKFFSFVNILGMTIGITACMLIVLFVSHELSYDIFHENSDRIYQVGLHGKIGEQEVYTSTTCAPMAAALRAEFPEVEDATRISYYSNQAFIKFDDQVFVEEKVFYADSNFFQFFSFELLEGDPVNALQEPNSIVLTTTLANKYFPGKSALGQLLTVGNENQTFKITGVAEPAPENSHFSYNALISASSSENLQSTMWLNNGLWNYFLLKPNTSIENVTSKFEDLVVKYIGPEIERFMGSTLEQMKDGGGAYGYFVTPLKDIHLSSNAQDGIEPAGNITYVYFFGAIGIFIILIACINFMNLSTAKSAGRAKEVGLRKTVGSDRSQLIGQFLAESTLFSMISVVLAIGLCYALLPAFNLLSGKALAIESLFNLQFFSVAAALVVLVGIIAGSYPAFYLTSFNTVEVLKGKVRSGAKSKGVRSTLVVFQFAISIFLIIFTLIVVDQLKFMQEKDLGIDKHNVMILQNANRLGESREAFKNTLLQQTGIVAASYTNNSFPGVNNTTVFKTSQSEQDHIMGLYYADYDHQDVMKFEMKEGRYFSEDFPSDSTAILLNEAAAAEFGWTNAVGEEILYNFGDGQEKLKVIGVYKDFNFESLKDKVRPLSIRLTKNSRNIMIRYEGSPATAIATVEKIWKEQSGNEPFEYTFLDENFDDLFRAEQRMSSVFSVFSGLAIFIACLGLFALAAFTAEQRTKEIGIRKAMGATVTGLTVLLSKEFSRLVFIAFIPAAGLAWYVADNWLDGFAYRIEISPLIFILSGLMAIGIAWLTVSFQSFMAANVSPTKSLKYE